MSGLSDYAFAGWLAIGYWVGRWSLAYRYKQVIQKLADIERRQTALFSEAASIRAALPRKNP